MSGGTGRLRQISGPTQRPVHHVGRVGALAVALGVGGVIAALPPAAADTGGPSDGGSSQTASEAGNSAGDSTGTRGPRAQTRTGSPDRSARGASERAGTAGEMATNARNPRTPVRVGADVPTGTGGSRSAPASDLIPVGPDSAPGGTTPSPQAAQPAAARVPAPAVIDRAPASAPDTKPDIAPADATPAATITEVAAIAAPVPSVVAAAVPVMTAAPATAAVSPTALTGLLDWLGGPGRTDIPAAAPLAWAAAAASRRELSAAPSPVAPAASVTTGQPVPASLADQIAGIGILAGLPEQIRAGIGEAAADWIGRTFGASAVTGVSVLVAGLGNNPTAAEVVAGVSDAVSGWWADSGLSEQVSALVDSVTGGALGSPAVLAALVEAADQIATAADPVAALPEALQALLANPAVSGPVDEAISGALDALATEFGPAVSEAIATWVDDPTLGSLAGAVTGFLGQPGVSSALADAAGQFGTALITGADPGAAVTAAWRSLQGDPAIQAVVDLTVADAVGGLLADAGTLEFLGDAVSGLVGGIAGDAELAALTASVLTGFLGHPGVPAALAAAAGDFAAAGLAGADLVGAATGAWNALTASPAIQAAVDLALSGALGGLLDDAETLEFLSSTVSDLVGGFVGDAALGVRVADQFVPLMVSVLIDGPVAVDDFEAPITELLIDLIISADPGSAELAPAVAAAGFAVLRAGLLGELSAVPATIEDLATDAAVLVGLAERIAEFGALGGLPAEIRTGLGDAAAYLLEQTFGNPVVAEALTPVFGAIDFPSGSAAVVEYLTDILENGFDVPAVLVGLLGPDVPVALSAFLGDPGVQQVFGTATVGAVSMLAEIVLDQVGAEGVIGTAVAGLLAAIQGDLADVIGTALVGFLNQPGVDDAVATGAVEAILAAVTSGTDPAEALQIAFEVLQANPAVVAAVDATLAGALDTLGVTVFGDAGVQEALGLTVTTLLTGLADDPAVQTVIADLLGTDFGPTVLGLLTDPSVGAATAGLLGSAVSDILGYQGAGAALTGALAQVGAAVVAGVDPAAALEDSLQSLAVDPAVRAALDAVLPTYLDALLDNGDIREGVGEVAREVVTELLRDNGIDDPGLAATVGQVAEVATVSLLANPAFGGLLTDLAADIAGGTPVAEVADVVVRAALGDPALQGALGAAVGQGIGSLLGDNLIGAVVGQVAGAVATLVIRVAAGLTLLFNPGVAGAAAATSGKPGGGYFELIPDWDAEMSSITVALAV